MLSEQEYYEKHREHVMQNFRMFGVPEEELDKHVLDVMPFLYTLYKNSMEREQRGSSELQEMKLKHPEQFVEYQEFLEAERQLDIARENLTRAQNKWESLGWE